MPEEGSDDVMFRSDVYDFPAIMGEINALFTTRAIQ